MPDIYTQTPTGLFPYLQFRPVTFLDVALQWFVNRTPLMSRLPSLPINADKFTMVGYQFRPRVTLIAANATATATTLSVNDASIFMNGDVLKISSTGEVVEVVATPDITNNILTIRRGVGIVNNVPTDGVAQPAAITADGTANVFNIGNSRTGGEKYQAGISQIPKSRDQNVQTFQHVVSVSGLLQAVGNANPQPDSAAPLPANKMRAMQALVDDVEVSSLIGVGEELGIGVVTRSKQHGLVNILKTTNLGIGGATNGYSGAPSNPSAYRPSDLQTDLFEPIQRNGGEVGMLLVSSKFQTGLTTWGAPLQLLPAGSTAYGTPIQTFYSSAMPPVPIMYSMWLDQCFPGSATVIALTDNQVRFRVLEALDYKEYGRAGDTGANGEGDWIHRCGLQVDNEQMHGMVRGITGFAKQS